MTKRVSPESQNIEYKSSWQEDYFEWICGYANARGGKLYIGVNDDGYVVGIKDTRFLLDVLPNQINSYLGIVVSIEHENADRGENLKYPFIPVDVKQKPENLYVHGILTEKAIADIDADPGNTTKVTPAVQTLFDAAPGFVKQLRKSEDFRRKICADLKLWRDENLVNVNTDGSLEYVWITVEPVPYGVSYHGHYYIRSGGTTTELKGMELSRFLMDKVGRKWDGMPVKKPVFNQEAFEYLRTHAMEKGRLTERQATVSDRLLIENLNMITDDGEYTRAAAMLFGNPEKVMVGSFIMIGYFAPAGSRGMNKANEVIYQDEIHGPLMLQADKAIEFLYTKYFKALIDYDGIHRVETFIIPQKAMREILLNAIAHKNYPSGNPIQIKVYDDHVTVMNEGFWPFDELPVEEAYEGEHSSYCSNPLIAAGLYTAGEIETWGQGFGKIRDVCVEAEVPLPEIKATKGSVTIIVHGSERYMRLLKRLSIGTSFVTGGEASGEVSGEAGGEVEKTQKIIEYCTEPRTKVEIQKYLLIQSERYVRERLINPLLRAGKLARTLPEKPSSPKQKYYSTKTEFEQAQAIMYNNPVLHKSPDDLRKEGLTVEEYLNLFSEEEGNLYRNYYTDEN